jgi:serine/threonine protein kinase
MKNGGLDLRQFCKKNLNNYLQTNKEEKVDKFLIEIHHLLKGLKFFKDNGLVHNDLKPQNILIDENGKMKFIDFGLMRTKKEIIKSSKNSDNYLGIYHWSYPFDCAFMNLQWYNYYKAIFRHNVQQSYKEKLFKLIINNDDNIVDFKMPISNPESFAILFSYINTEIKVPDESVQYSYIETFFEGFNKLIQQFTYENILDHIIDSIDIFSLGFTLQYVINHFNILNSFKLDVFTRLTIFFHSMYDFNPEFRITNINSLLNEYENILLEIGILTKYNKTFKNHILVDDNSSLSNIIKKRMHTLQKHSLSVELENAANKDPTKDFTPKLILKKQKILKLTKNNKFKECSDGKELNPNTNRCVNICKSGFVRDNLFKCVKGLNTNCPPGKELNPNTGNCVKQCNDGFIRNNKFQYRKYHTNNLSHSKNFVSTKSKSKLRTRARTRTKKNINK